IFNFEVTKNSELRTTKSHISLAAGAVSRIPPTETCKPLSRTKIKWKLVLDKVLDKVFFNIEVSHKPSHRRAAPRSSVISNLLSVIGEL
ncbi:MAG: hypothetical protein ACOCQP_02910, partial [Lentisphaeria bacterium]